MREKLKKLVTKPYCLYTAAVVIIIAFAVCMGIGSTMLHGEEKLIRKANTNSTSKKSVSKVADKKIEETDEKSKLENKSEKNKKTGDVKPAEKEKKTSVAKTEDKKNEGATDNSGNTNSNATVETTSEPTTIPEEKVVEQPKVTTEQPQKVAEQPKKAEPVWHDPVYEKKWVVDQAAWTETVNEPIYEMKEYSICSVCGADITGNPGPHLKQHALAGEGGGYHSEWRQTEIGTNTYTVPHEEVGHWEQVLVKEGYWE